MNSLVYMTNIHQFIDSFLCFRIETYGASEIMVLHWSCASVPIIFDLLHIPHNHCKILISTYHDEYELGGGYE